MPSLQTMIDDLPRDLDMIARHLGIARRTLVGYVRADSAPRAIMLALFWETQWGRSEADCEAANYGALQAQYAEAMRRKNENLLRQITKMEALIDTNAPFFRPGQDPAKQLKIQRSEYSASKRFRATMY